MKKIITLIAVLVACGFAQAEQFRIWRHPDDAIQRFVTYYVGSGFTLNGFKKEYRGCKMLTAKQFIKRERLAPHPHIVAAFYCEHATYVIADDYKLVKHDD